MTTLDSRIESYRKALGLSDNATAADVAEAYMRRMNQQRGASAPTPAPSPAMLAEQAELRELFQSVTLTDPAGMDRAALDKIEAGFAKYPDLYEAYRRLNTQAG